MTNIKLSKRLSLIASLVDDNSILADIGCDHALLDIYLSKNNVIKKAYACDITDGALSQAKKNIELYDAKNIYLRKADGLKALKKSDNVDSVVISGLGNKTIIDILSKGKDILVNVKTIIIQSNTKVNEIRKYLTKNGYIISYEKLILDRNIIYTIIKFTKGYKKYSNKELLFGPYLLKNKDNLFNDLMDKKQEDYKKILRKIPRIKIYKRFNILIKIFLLKKEKIRNEK